MRPVAVLPPVGALADQAFPAGTGSAQLAARNPRTVAPAIGQYAAKAPFSGAKLYAR
jgi:hypothetical protein